VRKLLRVSGVHSYTLLLDQTANTDGVVSALRSRLSDQGLEVVPWYRLADFYNKTAALFSRQVQVMRVIIAVIIALSISNSVMMSVMERTSEIGTAMAIGVRRRMILLQFVAEGSLLGLIGGLGGLLLGGSIAALASAIGVPMPAAPGMASGFIAGVDVSWASATSAFAIALVVAIAAAIYPAWRASRTNIIDALRYGH
jgi:putative ABC transport system permease protein